IGVLNTLDLASRHGARFLFASSSEVYGDPAVHPQHEGYTGNVHLRGVRACYDESKRFGEAAVNTYHRAEGLDTRIVRIFNTYGPRMRPHDGRAIPTFIRQARDNKPITVFGDGGQTRSFCYVTDLIEGFLRLIASRYHLPVNIGNPGEYTILQLAEAIIAATASRSEVVFEALPIDDPMVRRPDITRARELLDWGPTVELDEGLHLTLASWDEAPTAP
ncbi:MAG: NAD-dependent epimerase/dehydratase family protein, partial [Thermoleophilia bacterium]|nr:NAD-dependent epimerase/dehydratase family protein [Thermoleophilia bacterium]